MDQKDHYMDCCIFFAILQVFGQDRRIIFTVQRTTTWLEGRLTDESKAVVGGRRDAYCIRVRVHVKHHLIHLACIKQLARAPLFRDQFQADVYWAGEFETRMEQDDNKTPRTKNL